MTTCTKCNDHCGGSLSYPQCVKIKDIALCTKCWGEFAFVSDPGKEILSENYKIYRDMHGYGDNLDSAMVIPHTWATRKPEDTCAKCGSSNVLFYILCARCTEEFMYVDKSIYKLSDEFKLITMLHKSRQDNLDELDIKIIEDWIRNGHT